MKEGGFFAFLKRTYASADPRSLGIFRIALGLILFVDVARRWPEIEAHYANTGWLTNHFLLFRPMSSHLFSVYLAFSTPGEVKFLMAVHLVVCLLLVLGWKTRLMQLLAAVLLVSINSRNVMLENGGFVVLTALTIWTAFLPLGRRFSVDALFESLRLRREKDAAGLNDSDDPPRPVAPVVSLAVTALILQWVVIYFFNVVHKGSPEWLGGTAVYYLFQQDQLVTAFGARVRDHLPLGSFAFLTYSGLVLEVLIALLLVSPLRSGQARLLAFALALGLHLSIAAVVQLGPFSWAMIAMFIALVPAEAWQRWGPRLSARWRRFEVCFDPSSGFWISFCGVVKRLDVLGHVRFVPVIPSALDDEANPGPEADQDEDEDEADDEPDSTPRSVATDELPRLVARNLVVIDETTRAPFTGVAALLALARAIPGGRWLAAPLRLPGIRGFVERRLVRAAADSALLDEYFELERLPVEPEQRASEPAPVRSALMRVLAALRESAVVVLAVSCGVQVLVENRAVPAWLKPAHQPEWTKAMIVYPRLFQGWSLFAPPPLEDGRVVIDGVTRDGRRLDPLTGEPPSFDVRAPSGRRKNQLWGDFQRRVPEERFEPYMNGFTDFIRRHHEVVGRPADELISFEGWYVSEPIPAPGEQRVAPRKRWLFSEGVAKPGPRREHSAP